MLARVETRASASRTTVYCSRHDAARVLVQFSRYIYCTSCTTENSPCSTRSFYSYSLMICMHAPLNTPRILLPSPPCVGASEEVREEKKNPQRSALAFTSSSLYANSRRRFLLLLLLSLSLSFSLSFSLPFRPLLCCEVCIWVGIWEEIRRCEGWNRISLGLEVTKDSLRLVEIDEVD